MFKIKIKMLHFGDMISPGNSVFLILKSKEWMAPNGLSISRILEDCTITPIASFNTGSMEEG